MMPTGFERPVPQPDREHTPDAGTEGLRQNPFVPNSHPTAGEGKDIAATQPPAEDDETERY